MNSNIYAALAMIFFLFTSAEIKSTNPNLGLIDRNIIENSKFINDLGKKFIDIQEERIKKLNRF